jgi:hypothetical protein
MSPEQVAALYDAPDESPTPSPQSPSPHASKPMSKYRIAFLVWWTALLLFIATVTIMNWDMLPNHDSSLAVALMVVSLCLASWIPGAFLRLLWPQRP